MLRARPPGRLRRRPVAGRLVGEPEPVAGAAEADRRRDERAEPGEMPDRPLRVVEPGQRDEARHPLRVGIVGALGAEALGRDPVGAVDVAVLERLPREVRPPLHPHVRPPERLGRARRLEQVGLGVLPAPLAHPVEIALVGEPRVVLEPRGHGVDQVLQPLLVAARGDPRLRQPLPVLVDERQHRLRLAGQPAPEQHVEPGDMRALQLLLPARQDRRALGAAERIGRPGAGDLGDRLVLAAARRQRLGEPERPGAGLRRLGPEEGEDLLGRHAGRHHPLAGPAQGLEAGPVRVPGQEPQVLVPVPRPVAQPDPEDDVGGDDAAGPGGEAAGVRPVAARRRGERAGEHRALTGGLRHGARREPEPEAGDHDRRDQAEAHPRVPRARYGCGRLYHSVCPASASAELAVNRVHE